MSPEQARGQDVDGRSDLYSLGTVLYELVAGTLPFAGEYEQAVLYSILNEPPESLTALRAGVPMQLDWIVSKLLSKEAEYRYQTAADLLADLKSLDLSGSGTTRRSMPAMSVSDLVAEPTNRNTPLWMWGVVAAALFIGAAGVWFLKPVAEPVERIPAFVNLDLGGNHIIRFPSISDDGRFVSFRGRDSEDQQVGIYQLDISTGEIRRVSNSQSGQISRFSPDGRWLILDGSDIQKVPRVGGTPVQITNSGFWPVFINNETILLVSDEDDVFSISIEGDARKNIFRPDSSHGETRVYPTASLGDEKRVLMNTHRVDGRDVAIGSIEDGTFRVILRNANWARYVRSGHLVFIQGNESTGPLMARPFDVDREVFTGAAVPIIEGDISWLGFDISRSGVFVRWPGIDTGSVRQFYWYSSDGTRIEELPTEPGGYANPSISPDGLKIAVALANSSEGQDDIWVLDAATGDPYRLSYNGESGEPAWSADGEFVIYDGVRNSAGEVLLKKPADGSGTESDALGRQMTANDLRMSPDGMWRVFDDLNNNTNMTIVAVEDTSNSRTIIRSSFQNDATISPNGLFVAYSTLENGQLEIFVQEMNGDAFWTVSEPEDPNVGEARRSHDGQWLYYRSGDDLRRVRVEYDPSFRRVGRPETVLDLDVRFHYSLHPDGERILVLSESVATENPNDHIRAILNFDEYLRQVAPPDEK